MKYFEELRPALQKELGLKNHMAVPRLEKVVINMGVGEATQNGKLLDRAVAELAQIAGQKPIVTKARSPSAAFKLREGQSIGCMVTLRGDRMYEFFDRLVNVALPRVRDFRGVSSKSFDGRGNYTLGIKDQLIFPGDRLRQGGQDQGHEYFNHHHGRDRRRRAGSAAPHGDAVPDSGRELNCLPLANTSRRVGCKPQLLKLHNKEVQGRSRRCERQRKRWPEHPASLRTIRSPSSLRVSTIAASCADARALICASSAFAGCASADWHCAARFLGL